MTQWQDISTAPKDGSQFLAYGFYVYEGDTDRTEYMSIVSLSDAVPGFPWVDAEGAHTEVFYSHWMPLPPAPTPSRSETV